MSLLKTSVLSSAIVIIGALVGIISQKLYAVYTGAEGLLAIGNFNNFSSIVYVAASGGIFSGIVKVIAAANNQEEQQALLPSIYGLLLFFSLATSIILFISSNLIHEYLYRGLDVSKNVNMVFYASLPLIVFSNGMLYVYNGMKMVKEYAFFSILIHIINLFLTWLLVKNALISGALYSLFLPSVLGFLIMVFFSSQQFASPSFSFKKTLRSDLYKTLAGFSIVSILSILLLSSSQILLRNYILNSFTIDEAGYWQVLSNFSKIWMAVIVGILSLYFFPLMASTQNSNDVRREIWRLLAIGLPMVITAFILVYILRREFIELVYAPKFTNAAEFMFFQLIGDLLKTIGMVYAFVFLAKSRLRPYAVSEILYTVSYLLLTFWLAGAYGFKGVFMAYVVSYFIYVVMQVLIYKHIQKI